MPQGEDAGPGATSLDRDGDQPDLRADGAESPVKRAQRLGVGDGAPEQDGQAPDEPERGAEGEGDDDTLGQRAHDD